MSVGQNDLKKAILKQMDIPVWTLKKSNLQNEDSNLDNLLNIIKFIIKPDLNINLNLNIYSNTSNTLNTLNNTPLLLIVGREGFWAQLSQLQQENHLAMMERLVKALNRDFSECIIAEFKAEFFPEKLLINIAQANIEKAIVFGKNLSIFLGQEPSFSSKIEVFNINNELAQNSIAVAFVSSLDELEKNSSQKKEAWGCLAPAFSL